MYARGALSCTSYGLLGSGLGPCRSIGYRDVRLLMRVEHAWTGYYRIINNEGAMIGRITRRKTKWTLNMTIPTLQDGKDIVRNIKEGK